MDAGSSGLDEDNDELYLPRSGSRGAVRATRCTSIIHAPSSRPRVAAVNKLIKEAVPHLRVSVDARELLLKCSTGERR